MAIILIIYIFLLTRMDLAKADFLIIPYEQRNPHQHLAVTTFYNQIYPALKSPQAKMLSFLATLHGQPAQITEADISANTMLIYPDKQREVVSHITINNFEQYMEMNVQEWVITVSQSTMQKCLDFEGRSVEEEIKFFQSTKYFEDLTKKRIRMLLKHLQIMRYSFGQSVYIEGEPAVDEATGIRSVYIVRKGEFNYAKREQSSAKNIEILNFSAGQIFGSEQDVVKEEEPFPSHRHKNNTPIPKIIKKRKFTVTCKVSQGTVYQCSQEFFNNFLKSACEGQLQKNQDQLNEFCQQKIMSMIDNHAVKKQYLGPSIRNTDRPRAVNIPKLVLNRYAQAEKSQNQFFSHRSSSQQLPTIYQPQQSLLASKVEPSLSLRPQYQEQLQIIKRKEKFAKVREMTQPSSTKLTRGQVLFSLMKHSWNFEKEKRKTKR